VKKSLAEKLYNEAAFAAEQSIEPDDDDDDGGADAGGGSGGASGSSIGASGSGSGGRRASLAAQKSRTTISITIRDIRVQYEDQTCSSLPFAGGVTIAELHATLPDMNLVLGAAMLPTLLSKIKANITLRQLAAYHHVACAVQSSR
jgi:hypothetical protein